MLSRVPEYIVHLPCACWPSPSALPLNYDAFGKEPQDRVLPLAWDGWDLLAVEGFSCCGDHMVQQDRTCLEEMLQAGG